MFEPINKAHAIAEVVVFFQFTPDLMPVLPSLMNLKDALKAEFPRQEDIQSYEVELTGATGRMNALPAGLKLSRFRSDGQPEWQIQLGGQAISIHCLDYSRWSEVWMEMRKYISVIFSEMGAAPVDVSAIGLKYVDKFLCQNNLENYAANALLREDSEHLHNRAFNSGPRWHCHSGWFDEQLNAGEILNQLNVNSGFGIANGHQAIIVSIDHTQTLRSQSPNSLAKYTNNSEAGQALLDELMDAFHGGNKKTLSSLIQESMALKISLQDANGSNRVH